VLLMVMAVIPSSSTTMMRFFAIPSSLCLPSAPSVSGKRAFLSLKDVRPE
jgi:hypothetical protein